MKKILYKILDKIYDLSTDDLKLEIETRKNCRKLK